MKSWKDGWRGGDGAWLIWLKNNIGWHCFASLFLFYDHCFNYEYRYSCIPLSIININQSISLSFFAAPLMLIFESTCMTWSQTRTDTGRCTKVNKHGRQTHRGAVQSGGGHNLHNHNTIRLFLASRGKKWINKERKSIWVSDYFAFQ